jgi:hypoxanthine phosphoribosyltransferase
MSKILFPVAKEPSLSVVREIVYDQATILNRVGELGRRIDSDYRGRDLLVVGILKGGFVFTCDLIRNISSPVGLDFISVSRYQPGRDQGRIRILKDLQGEIAGRHLLLVEDIIDTGLTVHSLLSLLSRRNPASITVCTLLDRRDLRLVEVPIRYAGFQASAEFLIGYGLDYQDRYRNLPYIASMDLDAARVMISQSEEREREREDLLVYQAG